MWWVLCPKLAIQTHYLKISEPNYQNFLEHQEALDGQNDPHVQKIPCHAFQNFHKEMTEKIFKLIISVSSGDSCEHGLCVDCLRNLVSNKGFLVLYYVVFPCETNIFVMLSKLFS